jgi:hypothetical protein
VPHVPIGYGGFGAWRAYPVVRHRNSRSCEHGTGRRMAGAPIASRDKRGLCKWFSILGSGTSREP